MTEQLRRPLGVALLSGLAWLVCVLALNAAEPSRGAEIALVFAAGAAMVVGLAALGVVAFRLIRG